MPTWTVAENGRFEDGTVKHTVSLDGSVVGEMNYLEAQAHVMQHGKPEDPYIEEYEGGLPPVSLTVQQVFDGEKKWQEFLATHS